LPGYTNGVGTGTRFNYPSGIAVDSSGNLYVADYFNCLIRKVTTAGTVTTIAGSAAGIGGYSGSADGVGAAARFSYSQGIGVDSFGNLYVADSGNHIIRKITSGGNVTTIAGNTGSCCGSADGFGTAARFYRPQGIAIDSYGNLYIAESGNHLIRKITSGGNVSTIAGSSGLPGYNNGVGSVAMFKSPGESQ
jgi:sugar lactone lactonase YvrE